MLEYIRENPVSGTKKNADFLSKSAFLFGGGEGSPGGKGRDGVYKTSDGNGPDDFSAGNGGAGGAGFIGTLREGYMVARGGVGGAGGRLDSQKTNGSLSGSGGTAFSGTIKGGEAVLIGGNGDNLNISMDGAYNFSGASGGGGNGLNGVATGCVIAAPAAGRVFREWMGSLAVTFRTGSATTQSAIFTMPAQDVTAVPTYKAITVHPAPRFYLLRRPQRLPYWRQYLWRKPQ